MVSSAVLTNLLALRFVISVGKNCLCVSVSQGHMFLMMHNLSLSALFELQQ